MSTPLYTDLFPFRSNEQHNIIEFYSQNGTGIGGRFVVLETGNNAPLDRIGKYVGSVGASYAGTFNGRYENPSKFSLAASGDTNLKVLGLTLYGTVEYDSNGQKLILEPELAKQYGCVISGQSSPIAYDGVFRLSSNAYAGQPLPGKVGVISDAGKVYFTDVTTEIIQSGLAVCKVISSSGNLNGVGGYADIKLTLK